VSNNLRVGSHNSSLNMIWITMIGSPHYMKIENVGCLAIWKKLFGLECQLHNGVNDLNAFFNRFINSATTLQEFVVQYENALRNNAEKECQTDFASLNTTIPCATQSLIERKYQEVYTHAKFAKI